jgi:hypothetical protein
MSLVLPRLPARSPIGNACTGLCLTLVTPAWVMPTILTPPYTFLLSALLSTSGMTVTGSAIHYLLALIVIPQVVCLGK